MAVPSLRGRSRGLSEVCRDPVLPYRGVWCLVAPMAKSTADLLQWKYVSWPNVLSVAGVLRPGGDLAHYESIQVGLELEI